MLAAVVITVPCFQFLLSSVNGMKKNSSWIKSTPSERIHNTECLNDIQQQVQASIH